MTGIPIRTRRITYDPKCEELADHYLASIPGMRKLAYGEYLLHVDALAQELQRTLEEFSVPKE